MAEPAGAAPSDPPGGVGAFLRSSPFLAGLVGLGVVLRAWAYFARPPLWLDEILLSRNIVELPVRALLTEPLRLDQVAPRGFLLVEKLIVLAAGSSELALRLFPFLCGVAGMFLFRRLATRTLDGFAVSFATALFAIGIPFLKFGAEVKQYEVDVTAAILLLLLALDLIEHETSARQLVAVGLLGFVLVWFSQASVIAMGGIGLALGLQWLAARDLRTGRVLLLTMPGWAAGALAAIVVGSRSMTPSTRAFMDEFWSRGFLPKPFTPLAALAWLSNQGLSAFSDLTMLRYEWPALFLGMAMIGMTVLWLTRRRLAGIILGPLVLALVAAAAHQYPFRGRLMLYLMPGLLLTIAAGAEWLRQRVSLRQPVLGAVVMIACLVPPVRALLAAPPPYDLEHMRSVMAYLQSHREPGDVVYVFPLHRIGALYYGPRYGLSRDQWTTAICDRNEIAAYLRDVDRYRGTRRLWLISTGVPPFLAARNAVRGYLGTIGEKRDSLSYPSLIWGATTLDLYDLSDSTRLATASADSVPVVAVMPTPRPSCRPWQSPSVLDDPF